jgi:hypothetical protein
VGRGAATDELTAVRARRSIAAADPLDRTFQRFCRNHLDFRVIETTEAAADLIARIRARKIRQVALDFETAKGSWDAWGTHNGSIRLVQIGIEGQQTGRRKQWLIDCHKADPETLVPLLTDRTVSKQIFFSQFEQAWAVNHLGVPIANVTDPCFNEQSIQVKLADIAKTAALDHVRERLIERSQLTADQLATNRKRNTLPNIIDLYIEHATPTLTREELLAEFEPVMTAAGVPAAQAALKEAAERANVSVDHTAWTGKQPANLAALAERYMGMRVPKDEQDSEWAAPSLDASQLRYAAIDVAIMPDLTRATAALAKELGVTGKVRYRQRKTIERALQREREVSGVEPRDGHQHPRPRDHSGALAWELTDARTLADLEAVWLRIRRDGVTWRNRQTLKPFYQQIRARMLAEGASEPSAAQIAAAVDRQHAAAQQRRDRFIRARLNRHSEQRSQTLLDSYDSHQPSRRVHLLTS